MAVQTIVKDEKTLEKVPGSLSKNNDLNNNGIPDKKENDLNNNGIPDKKEKDLNNNGIPDKIENLQVHYDTFKANYLKDGIKGESALESYRDKYPENYSRLQENALASNVNKEAKNIEVKFEEVSSKPKFDLNAQINESVKNSTVNNSFKPIVEEIKDSYNYAGDYGKELKNSKNLEQKINVEAREIEGLKNNLIKSKTFGSELEHLDKVSVKELSQALVENSKDISKAKNDLENLEAKYKNIKDSISSKNIERNPAVYEFLQKNNTVQNNPLKKFFGIEKDFKNVSNKDLKTLLPKLEAEYNSAKKEAVGKVDTLEKGGNILRDAIDLKNREVNIAQSRDKLSISKNNLEQLSRPIKNLIEKIIDLDLKGIREALKRTNPKDLAVYIKEAISKNRNSKDNDKIISLGEKLETLSKSPKQEVNVKR